MSMSVCACVSIRKCPLMQVCTPVSLCKGWVGAGAPAYHSNCATLRLLCLQRMATPHVCMSRECVPALPALPHPPTCGPRLLEVCAHARTHTHTHTHAHVVGGQMYSPRCTWHTAKRLCSIISTAKRLCAIISHMHASVPLHSSAVCCMCPSLPLLSLSRHTCPAFLSRIPHCLPCGPHRLRHTPSSSARTSVACRTCRPTICCPQCECVCMCVCLWLWLWVVPHRCYTQDGKPSDVTDLRDCGHAGNKASA